MKRLIVCLAVVPLLSSCAGLGAVDSLCHRRNLVEPVLLAARAQAMTIEDPIQRQAAVSAFDISLAAFSKCPLVGAPTSPGA